MGLGCGIRKEPEQRGIHDFSSDVISSTDQRENHKLTETNLLCVLTVSLQVSMQAINSNGSVSCHVLSNVSIIARLRKYYEIV